MRTIKASKSPHHISHQLPLAISLISFKHYEVNSKSNSDFSPTSPYPSTSSIMQGDRLQGHMSQSGEGRSLLLQPYHPAINSSTSTIIQLYNNINKHHKQTSQSRAESVRALVILPPHSSHTGPQILGIHFSQSSGRTLVSCFIVKYHVHTRSYKNKCCKPKG